MPRPRAPRDRGRRRRRRPRRSCSWPSRGACRAVHLRPVEADQRARRRPRRGRSPAGSNHGSADPLPQVVLGPAALLGVVGEGRGVDREPGLVVVAGHGSVRTVTPAGQRLAPAAGGRASGASASSVATRLKPERSASARRAGLVAVRPQPQRPSGVALEQPRRRAAGRRRAGGASGWTTSSALRRRPVGGPTWAYPTSVRRRRRRAVAYARSPPYRRCEQHVLGERARRRRPRSALGDERADAGRARQPREPGATDDGSRPASSQPAHAEPRVRRSTGRRAASAAVAGRRRPASALRRRGGGSTKR